MCTLLYPREAVFLTNIGAMGCLKSLLAAVGGQAALYYDDYI